MDWYENIVPKDKNFTLVDTPKKFSMMTRALDGVKLVGVDLETTGLNPRKDIIVGMSIASSFLDAFYIPLCRSTGDPYWENVTVNRWMDKWLRGDNVKKIMQNGKFDRKMLRKKGLDVENFVFDTMLAAHLLNENVSKKLEECGGRELDSIHSTAHFKLSQAVHNMGITPLDGAKGMLRIPINLMKNYACMDVTTTYELSSIYQVRMEEQNLDRLFYVLIMPLQEVLMEMEERGVRIDVDKLRQLREGEPEHVKLEEQILELAGYKLNLNSPEQISELLYQKLKLTAQKEKNGKLATDDTSLGRIVGEHPIVELIRKYRSFFKLYTSYVVALSELLEGDRIYTDYLVHGTRTGRLASANPNLQNIPARSQFGKLIRECFVPDLNCKFGDYDFSQIELRVLAYYSRDLILLDAYKTNKDIHRKTASVAFKISEASVSDDQRVAGKTLNFGVVYGMTEYGLVDSLKGHWKEGVSEYLQAREFINRYFDEYKGVSKLVNRVYADLDKTNEVVSMFGRKRRLPEIRSAEGGMRRYLQRQCFNAYIQGTASDITSLALIRVNRRLKEEGFKSRPVLDVHDELIFNVLNEEVEDVVPMIKNEMEQLVGDMDVPLVVDEKLTECWKK